MGFARFLYGRPIYAGLDLIRGGLIVSSLTLSILCYLVRFVNFYLVVFKGFCSPLKRMKLSPIGLGFPSKDLSLKSTKAVIWEWDIFFTMALSFEPVSMLIVVESMNSLSMSLKII